VLFATSLAATLIFSPFHLERFGGALVHALASLSNFFFWNESGYFDVDASFKPLLHTWSLSVEEQFYLIWPLTLVLLLKRLSKAQMLIALFSLGIISLFLNHVFADGNIRTLTKISPAIAEWFSDGQATIFYLTPFRGFEFMIGAALVWLNRYAPKHHRGLDSFFMLGLLMAILPVFLYTEETLFPSYNALAPAIGTGLMIFARQSPWIGMFVRNRFSVGIGLISYSLYLVHWPIIVFYSYLTLSEPGMFSAILIAFLSIIFAAGIYKFVEQPFRKKKLAYGTLWKRQSSFRFSVWVGLCIVIFDDAPSGLQYMG